MARGSKNLVMSVAFKNVADLPQLLTKVTKQVKEGVEANEINYKSASVVFSVEYPFNGNYKDRIIDGKHVRVYKSKI